MKCFDLGNILLSDIADDDDQRRQQGVLVYLERQWIKVKISKISVGFVSLTAYGWFQ